MNSYKMLKFLDIYSCLLIIIYSYYKDLTKNSIQNLIFGINLTDFIYSIANIMPQFENGEMYAFSQVEAMLRVSSFHLDYV